MKKLFLFLVIFLYFFQNTTFAEDCEYEDYDPFWKYECRVRENCKIYKDNQVFIDTSNKERKFIVSASTSYNDAIEEINNAVETYNKNMNDIYKCALINVQYNSFDLILKKISTNESLKKSIEPKIKEIKQKLSVIWSSENLKCKNINKNIQLKQNVLKQTTYEICKYSFYMTYLKEHYSNFKNVSPKDISENKQVQLVDFSEISKDINFKIDVELKKAYKIFPIAFASYSEYESYFPVHYLLDTLKYDFITFRQKLHEVLTPINQVVYKISNAMSK